MLLVEKINQTARCCYQHIATFLQRGYLVLVASATSNNDGLLTSGCANAFSNVVNLGRKLSRWCDDERAGIRVALGVTTLGVTLGTRVGPGGCVASGGCAAPGGRVGLLGVGLLGPIGFLDSNALQRRQHKRCSFTRSRLRRRNNVLAREDGGNCRGLHGSRRVESKCCYACQNLLV